MATLALLALCGTARAERLRVVTTVTDLAALTRAVGGGQVEVTSLVRGPHDPHYVDPRPSFVRKLHDADLYVEMGMELEDAWASLLLRSARNPKILPSGPGYLNASAAIRPLAVPTAPVDRSMGDIHVYGNPHYLVDPLNGLRVAGALRDKLSLLRPAAAERFRAGYAGFEKRLLERLVGPELAGRRPAGELVAALERGSLSEAPGGWLGRAAALRGLRAVEDHEAWVYFANRFGLELVATLEPRPGIAPTTRHLQEVVSIVEARKATLILASPYFDPRHARWVQERTGAALAPMAHQVDSREKTGDYLETVEYNVRSVLDAAAAGGAAR
jgi:ABC-type Zn uptake system ZnuABC Zn-binding protein ZnuA